MKRLGRSRAYTASLTLIMTSVMALGGVGQSRAETMAANAEKTIRVATFNAALNRPKAGELAKELQTGQSVQAQRVAEIIQRVAPDVLVLQEFDWDENGVGLALFQENYLRESQNGAPPQNYPHIYIPSVNTGEPSGFDLDRNGKQGEAGDAYGFGRFPGQYGFVILSKHPLESKNIRTFQRFLWASMPGARLPENPKTPGQGWYDKATLGVLRLSSKNHVDVPVRVGSKVIHLLVSHPTPPVFDGPENRNGRRNFDEIRLWADYISPRKAGYLTDDHGKQGGLKESASFVIIGDLNADPIDGDSMAGAMAQLSTHPRVHQQVATGKQVPTSLGGQINAKRQKDRGNPAHDTAGWGLRVDYVLPSADLVVSKTGIFWPPPNDPLAYLIKADSQGRSSSDHRLVWVDIQTL